MVNQVREGKGERLSEGDNYVQYFYFQRNTKAFNASSLWAVHSHLNNNHE